MHLLHLCQGIELANLHSQYTILLHPVPAALWANLLGTSSVYATTCKHKLGSSGPRGIYFLFWITEIYYSYKSVSASFFFFFLACFPWSNLLGKSENTLEIHTFDFKTLEKTKQSFSALLWVKKASTAGQGQSTPTSHQGLTSPPQPHSFPIKTQGRGGESSCQRPAQAPTASTLWRRLYILHKWHHWGKISQESASLTSVSVLSKSEMIYPQKKPQQACKDKCSRVYTITEGNDEGELEKLNWRLIRKLCS